MKLHTIAAVLACACVGWTRLSGRVKIVNLKDQTVTIQNKDGDLLTVPIDYQVRLLEKHDELKSLKDLQLDEKITLINTPSEKPKTPDDSDMAQPETQSGQKR